MVQHSYIEEKKKAGPFQWLIVIIVPLIFSIIIALIILAVMGFDVIGKAKDFANQVPFLSSAVTTEEEQIQISKLENLQKEISDKETKLEQLTAEMNDKDQTINALNKEVESLTKQLAEQQSGRQAQEELLSDITSSFTEIEPGVAAPIISNLEDDLAVSVLMNLPNQERGAILGEMDPEAAAQLTNLLLKTPK